METERTLTELEAPFLVLADGYRQCRYCGKLWNIDKRECKQPPRFNGHGNMLGRIDRISETGRPIKMSIAIETVCSCIDRDRAIWERDIILSWEQVRFSEIDGRNTGKAKRRKDW